MYGVYQDETVEIKLTGFCSPQSSCESDRAISL